MSFISTLSIKDRNRLRTIVKNVHLKYYPKDMITNYEADKLIDSFGEQTVYQLLKNNIDSKNVD
jgi:hypothetical protein